MRPAAIGLGTANAFYARRFKGGVFDQFEFETAADDVQPLFAKSQHVILLQMYSRTP